MPDLYREIGLKVRSSGAQSRATHFKVRNGSQNLARINELGLLNKNPAPGIHWAGMSKTTMDLTITRLSVEHESPVRQRMCVTNNNKCWE
jgi:hypothetical protein